MSENLPIVPLQFDLRRATGRKHLAELPGGATLAQKLNIITATLEVIRERHREEMPVETWAKINEAMELLSTAGFIAIQRKSAGLLHTYEQPKLNAPQNLPLSPLLSDDARVG